MFHWRISKYNPRYRDSDGAYRIDEWTAATDIGTMISGVVVTSADYIAVEGAYIAAVQAFMAAAGLELMVIEELELGGVTQNALAELTPVDIHVADLAVGQQLTGHVVAGVCRLALRSVIWCKLAGAGGFHVHFGHDYYMYIGTPLPSKDAIAATEASGLFVERKRSPYL